MRCLSFFINIKKLGNKLCVGTCLKCLTVATPLRDKAFEDKMNCQFQRVSYSTHCKCLSFNVWKLVISTINIKQT